MLVPGQVISKEILYFLAELDVKEIHGYNPELGLAVFTPRRWLGTGRPRGGARVSTLTRHGQVG